MEPDNCSARRPALLRSSWCPVDHQKQLSQVRNQKQAHRGQSIKGADVATGSQKDTIR